MSALLAASLAGCSTEESASPRSDTSPTTDAGTSLPQSDEPVELDPSELTPEVTNPWFPLRPATRWTYREVAEDGERLSVVVTSTPITHDSRTA